jgi:hypothetical protein
MKLSTTDLQQITEAVSTFDYVTAVLGTHPGELRFHLITRSAEEKIAVNLMWVNGTDELESHFVVVSIEGAEESNPFEDFLKNLTTNGQVVDGSSIQSVLDILPGEVQPE